MSKIQYIIALFILLVIVISMSVIFNVTMESFRSSSPNHRGYGIGDTYQAPLDLLVNTDNTRNIFNKRYSVNENGSDDVPTFFGFSNIF
jgi:hypothetical protein